MSSLVNYSCYGFYYLKSLLFSFALYGHSWGNHYGFFFFFFLLSSQIPLGKVLGDLAIWVLIALGVEYHNVVVVFLFSPGLGFLRQYNSLIIIVVYIFFHVHSPNLWPKPEFFSSSLSETNADTWASTSS